MSGTRDDGSVVEAMADWSRLTRPTATDCDACATGCAACTDLRRLFAEALLPLTEAGGDTPAAAAPKRS